MSGQALVIRAGAEHIPMPDESVDLIVTSPPYFGQRSYRDGGEHYDGQIGSEATPQEFLAAMWSATGEWWRVLKPTGSAFVNFGDKRSGSGAPGTTSGLGTGGHVVQGARSGIPATREQADLDRSRSRNVRATAGYTRAAFGRAKSKQLLPHRYAIGCEDGEADPDGIGWIVRQDMVWWKSNGLPESVTDRTRDSHEYWFHLTREGQYYTAIDEIREAYAPDSVARRARGRDEPYAPDGQRKHDGLHEGINVGGALPPSVWQIATEPLKVPAWLDVDHFAAFPTEWPRRLILGWSPPAICLECGQGRFPVTEVEHEIYREATSTGRPKRQDGEGPRSGNGFNGEGYAQSSSRATIIGYACACTPSTYHPERRRKTATPKRPDGAHRPPEDLGRSNTLPEKGLPVTEYHLDGWTPPPSRPAVVLDPFGGTGTTAMVARALGRIGISIDLSFDYSRLARWRIFESGHGAKVVGRTNRDRQGSLL